MDHCWRFNTFTRQSASAFTCLHIHFYSIVSTCVARVRHGRPPAPGYLPDEDIVRMSVTVSVVMVRWSDENCDEVKVGGGLRHECAHEEIRRVGVE